MPKSKIKNLSPLDQVQKCLSVRIAELRTAKSLTQHELAKKAGIALQYLQKIEQGDRAPSLKTLAALAMALDLPVAELFNFENRVIENPRVEGQVLRLRELLEGAAEDDLKLLNRIAERFMVGSVSKRKRR